MVKIKRERFGLNISEEEYRKLPLPSYSFFSDVQKLEEIAPGTGHTIIGNVANSNNNDEDGIIFGSIVDQILTDGKADDDNIIIVKKKPSGKMKDMIRTLKLIKEFLSEPEDLFHFSNISDIINIANEFSYFPKKSDELRLDGFRNYEEYVNHFFKDENDNKIITTEYQYKSANRVATMMLNEFPILSGTYFSEEKLQILKQVKIIAEINGVYVKCMLDMILINHESKIVVPLDIKTGAARTDEFEASGYYGWNYYIQSSLYRRALIYYIENFVPELSEYEIKPFSFIFADRIKFSGVVRYDVDDENDDTAFNHGFTVKNFKDPSIIHHKLSTAQLLDIYSKNLPTAYNDYIKTLDMAKLYEVTA